MSIFKYLIGIWTAIVVYTLFAFLAGPKGLFAYNFLLSEKERQMDNIRELGILNEDLERVKNNLIFDQDTLLVQARQMGYASEDERFIRIVGLSNVLSAPAETGIVYSAHIPEYFSEQNIKIAAISIGFLLFAFLFMLEFIDKRAVK